MKHPIYLLAGLFVAVWIVPWNCSARPEAAPAAGNEALLEKQAVAKVFAAHRFTPPAPLPGPPGLTWYVGSRAFTIQVVEQVMVGVRRGASFTVEFTAYRRDREDSPWVAAVKSSEPSIVNAERRFREELRKELALEEKPK